MRDGQHYPQVQQEEPLNLEQLFRGNMRAIEHFVAARVRDEHDAQDIVAETFAQTVEYCRRTEREIPHARALLFTIAKGRIADYYESRKRSLQREVPVDDAPPIVAPGSISATIDTNEELRIVRAGLLVIREQYREIITLHAVVGLSIREIAELTGKSDVHVRVVLFRARKALRKAIATHVEPTSTPGTELHIDVVADATDEISRVS